MHVSCSNNIRYNPCLCLHMQQTDREWLIRALCWTHARCSAQAVTYFTPSLSDNHTQASTKGQEGSPSPVCSTCIPRDQTQCGCTPNLPVSTSNICTVSAAWLKNLQTLGLHAWYFNIVQIIQLIGQKGEVSLVHWFHALCDNYII